MKDFIDFPGPKVFELIGETKQDTLPLWGQMSAQHMLEHLILPLQFSRGLFEVPLATPPDKVEKVKRILLLGDAPLKRDFVAPFQKPGLQDLKFEHLDEARVALLQEIALFLRFWEGNKNAQFTHPIFGVLNRDEWYLFHRKHFTHHFAQFGLL